ncbi:MAG: HAMP domain-containing protein [Nitrospira sp.]|nr:MAG: HAMP domain-containing protein [Nitrospira sp.]
MVTWFGNMKTMWKLILGFVLTGVLVAAMGGIIGQGVLSIREQLRVVYEDYTVAGTDLALVASNLNRTRTNDFLALDASTAEEFEKTTSADAEITESVKKPLEAYAATVLRISKTGRNEAKDLQKFRDTYAVYVESSNLLYETLRQSWNAPTKSEMEALRAKARTISIKNAGPKMEATIIALNELVATVKEVAKDMNEAGAATVTSTLSTLTVGTTAVIILGIFIGWLIAHFLVRNLNNVVMAAQAIGGGDMSARSSVTTKDEVGTLAQSFNEMGDKLQANVTKEREQAAKTEQFVAEAKRVLGNLAQGDLTDHMTNVCEGEFEQMKSSLNNALQNLTATITTVRSAVEAVTSGSEEITKGSEDLSQRTAEQASALEETSASMEEMTSTVKQNADNAKQANQLAIAARDIADKGGAITTKAVEAMGEINKSSKKIADIITVIDEIAFQTNLLALNAAVEAARAGEHGRGFAVVAAEVRNLAQRSATAAKEIKGLINESIQRVTDGSELVDQSGKTLGEIVSSVKRVTDIIAEITAASQEQASGIDQVNKAIMQMDETTQQNAALVEETTSASQSMKDQARELMRQVGAFKVTGGGQESHTRSSAAQATHKPSLPSSGPVRKPLIKKPSSYTTASEPVGLAAGNGKDHRSKEAEFEEF